ncbi:MAG: ATP synthase F1 subunit epsilon [Candidatus Moraniibacteriota bacterium]|nr:MAG: ATP synthase F1 subunit epsilon [Candidatus Moranbacteria bacterium]
MPDIKLKIVTPERVVYEGEVDQVTLPVSDGEVTILPKHRSYIASLTIGEIMTKIGNEEDSVAVAGGFLEFADNKLIVLADEAERADEIDIEKAEAARKRAEDLKSKTIRSDETEYARVAAALEKEMSKIRVAKKYMARKGF